MARDIPFIPRFYIDHFQFLKHTGIVGMFSLDNDKFSIKEDEAVTTTPILETQFNNLFDYNPVNQGIFPYYSLGGSNQINEGEVEITLPTGNISTQDWDGNWYIASLGHNHYNSFTEIYAKFTSVGDEAISYQERANTTEIINSSSTNTYNGFSIEKFTDKPIDNDYSKYITIGIKSRENNQAQLTDINLGAISLGKYFDLSISSDVKMSMEYQFGVKTKKSKSGSHLSNMEWWQKPSWGNHPAWELNNDLDVNYQNKVNEDLGWRKSGRRVYDLAFTFLSSDEVLATSGVLDGTTLEGNQFDGDTSGELTDSTAEGSSATVSNTSNPINIKNDHSIFAQIVHKTMGFQLPFIFQPNKDYAKPDGFMFARIAEKSYELEQLADNLWRCKFKIEEIW